MTEKKNDIVKLVSTFQKIVSNEDQNMYTVCKLHVVPILSTDWSEGILLESYQN